VFRAGTNNRVNSAPLCIEFVVNNVYNESKGPCFEQSGLETVPEIQKLRTKFLLLNNQKQTHYLICKVAATAPSQTTYFRPIVYHGHFTAGGEWSVTNFYEDTGLIEFL